MMVYKIMHKLIKEKVVTKYRAGFTLVEIVVGIGMLTVFIEANFLYYKQVLNVSQQTTRHIQSGFLLEEGVEAVKLLRDESWSGRIATLTNGTIYYLLWDNVTKKWTSTTVPQLIESTFTRSFTVAAVNRDSTGPLTTFDNIVSSGGALDAGTKKLVVTVTWPMRGGNTSTSSVETYITNIFNN